MSQIQNARERELRGLARGKVSPFMPPKHTASPKREEFLNRLWAIILELFISGDTAHAQQIERIYTAFEAADDQTFDYLLADG